MEHAERRRVGVERPLLRFHQAAVQGHHALLAAERAPLRIGRVVVLVVIDIHGERQRMLVEVAVAAGGLALLLRTAKRGQEQRGEDGDDRDHDQQLDQREAIPS